jgi:isoamylase
MELPVVSGREWCLAVDSSCSSPDDIVPPQNQHPIKHHSYLVNCQTVVVFENRRV